MTSVQSRDSTNWENVDQISPRRQRSDDIVVDGIGGGDELRRHQHQADAIFNRSRRNQYALGPRGS